MKIATLIRTRIIPKHLSHLMKGIDINCQNFKIIIRYTEISYFFNK